MNYKNTFYRYFYKLYNFFQLKLHLSNIEFTKSILLFLSISFFSLIQFSLSSFSFNKSYLSQLGKVILKS